jgi:hypothetical protein
MSDQNTNRTHVDHASREREVADWVSERLHLNPCRFDLVYGLHMRRGGPDWKTAENLVETALATLISSGRARRVDALQVYYAHA